MLLNTWDPSAFLRKKKKIAPSIEFSKLDPEN